VVCTGVSHAEAPKVDLSKLGGREIRVRAGEPIRVDVPVSGSPAPVVSWQKENKSLSPSDRVSLTFVAFGLFTSAVFGGVMFSLTFVYRITQTFMGVFHWRN